MATFRFQFETVLNHRQMVEDGCQRELARHLRMRMILQDQLRTMQQTITQSKQQLSGGLVGKVDLESIAGFARYSGQVTQQAQQLVLHLSQLEKQVQAARAKLAEAVRQRKAMELLRDKHRQQWLQEQQRRETVELDEIATQQYIRDLIAGSAR